MKLIANEEGRFVYLFPFEELTPLSGTHPPDLMKKIIDEYQFGRWPDLNKLGTDQGRTFRDGRTVVSNRQINIKELSLYSDGIVLSASTTEEAEIAVHHILNWARQNLGCRELQSEPEKRYSSDVVVEFERPMDLLLKNLNALNEIAAPLLSETYGIDAKPQMHGFEIAIATEALPRSLLIGAFRIQRRAGVPYSSERFFCQAPLPNEAHMKWLQGLEDLA